ncbi:hypothetical protein GLOIN_2v1693735 [Rhizophagus irregularis DAOM 181602=DAOM 197198]|uniref:Uncharacterized protein n=1 Tax=Rhizophagus irregularis (strain DAOM 181602 / DAOM 197198 / MUCL 43194) TaxID=747089 RepID=A0A2H5TEI2_RHIID|nr:hypothetical protein GLOIN_2v1693735 [Rhizophagus irregularis DAOM 181602=DAOM 197198]POG62699.1 hypothetical protein GLOIN_2v1693735 [Rhizophagus irregularis DAOM 181602=DAOM 197198]GBC40986.1 hypothetical protein GLOIN_2v1693735 [Rhizophagus irregularis DAOM 181602=DAOM 197198]|eukprot:XP_025169565.1 hypothetical protein GLOIN_2v1693735 [Rhizophagus irregularis DAOM 181602=DAOM 197198]
MIILYYYSFLCRVLISNKKCIRIFWFILLSNKYFQVISSIFYSDFLIIERTRSGRASSGIFYRNQY